LRGCPMSKKAASRSIGVWNGGEAADAMRGADAVRAAIEQDQESLEP